MIYAASFFDKKKWHGRLVPISRSIPKNVEAEFQADHPLRWVLAPPKSLLEEWKQWEDSYKASGDTTFPHEGHIAAYTDQYRVHVRAGLKEIKEYLADYNPWKDETWLCWEPAGAFCHRNLAIALVKGFRPDCFGGQDIPNLIGRKVRLKNTDRTYEIIQEIEENHTAGRAARLRSPDGRTATWMMGQLELID